LRLDPAYIAELFGGIVGLVRSVAGGAAHHAQIVINSTGYAVQIAANAVGNLVTFLLAGLIDVFGNESRILETAPSVFTRADNPSRDELIDKILRRSPS